MKSSRRWEEIEISPSQARMFIKVAEELTGNRSTSNTLGVRRIIPYRNLAGRRPGSRTRIAFRKERFVYVGTNN